MVRRHVVAVSALALGALAACSSDQPTPVAPTTPSAAQVANGSISINVLLDAPISDAHRAELGKYGTIGDEIAPINALTMRIMADQLAAVQALPFVASAAPDAERKGAPVDAVLASNFTLSGRSTWDQDAINVTNPLAGANNDRVITETGAGVYIGVLDSGLLDSWRQYFPEQRIATALARSFTGADNGTVAEQPNKWEHDQNSHGTHVTSTILGYSFNGTAINGTAPMATVIPVKVLNQNGSGWSSMIAQGIVYIADLKAGVLNGAPTVINMSLGGSRLDAVEKAAIDYAVAKGVIVVAAAGNEGTAGMIYPGAYAPVISVAASGWKRLAAPSGLWTADVPDPTNPADFFIVDWSSRATRPEHDLDVAAPGVNVVGPYQLNSGATSYYFLGGTSMASPHVAGIVALMAERKPTLGSAEAEAILTSTAVPISGVAASVQGAGLATADAALNALSTTRTKR